MLNSKECLDWFIGGLGIECIVNSSDGMLDSMNIYISLWMKGVNNRVYYGRLDIIDDNNIS